MKGYPPCAECGRWSDGWIAAADVSGKPDADGRVWLCGRHIAEPWKQLAHRDRAEARGTATLW
jgi:hypothetical protein